MQCFSQVGLSTIGCVFRHDILIICSWKPPGVVPEVGCSLLSGRLLTVPITVNTILRHGVFIIIADFMCSLFIMSQDTATTTTPPLTDVCSGASSVTTTVKMAPSLGSKLWVSKMWFCQHY